MGKRVILILRPIVMALLIAAAVTFTVLGITTAIISDTATVNAESVEHSHEGYTAWTSTTSLPDLAGSYYLTADVTIASGTWIVPTGTTCLCLNGHGIIGNNGNSVITVGSGAVLYLEDCLDTAHKYTVDANHLATVDDSLEGVEGVDYFTFTGGYITGAKRTAYNSVGGGVNIEGGTLYINGGTIIGNSADRGGGVRCGGTLVMNGGAIVNNYNRGLSNNMAQKPVKIGSGAIIEGNVDEDGNPCDIWLLQSGNKIELLGELSNNKPIGVYMGTATGTFTSGLSGKGTAVNFISTNDAYFVKLNGDGEAQLAEKVVSVTVGETVTYYDNVSDALSAWTEGSTLKLLKDVTISSTIVVDNGTKTLDLNGHGIKKTGTGRVFTVINGATFNITDGNPQAVHKFTVSNGLATVNDDLQSGYQTFTGGYITGGDAKGGDENGWGGCLVVSLGGKRATLNISGGTIIGNRCDMSGAAIRVGGDKNDYTVFNMTGGAIMYNTAGQGGAVTWEPNVTVKIGGGVIDNNFVGSNEVNVYLEGGQKITVDTAFTATASIGVTLQNGQGVFTSGWNDYMEDADPYDYFISDNGAYEVRLSNNEAYVGTHVHTWEFTVDGNVITATCLGLAKPTCGLTAQTLTINATGKSYDGQSVVATVVKSAGWTVANGLPEIPEITYSGNVNAGTYTASITVAEKTATAEFTITPINATITITGHKTTVDYNGEEQSVSGYDVEFSTDLYTAENFTFSGTDIVALKNVGTAYMGLTASQFANISANFATVVFTVVDGYITVEPINATVVITGHKTTVDYNGKEQSVNGYDVEFSTDLYTAEDFTFSGMDIAKLTNVGTVYMELDASQFANISANFATVVFTVDDGYITVEPIDATVIITGHTTIVDYNGTEQIASGYDVEFSTDLYTVEDFTFSGANITRRTNVGTSYMGLKESRFANINSNFKTVTFNITDGYIKIRPIDITVTVIGYNDTVDYDGKEHIVSGYDAKFSTDLYAIEDFTFSGTDSVKLTNAGTSYMELLASQFENTNANFANVIFNVVDGYLTIKPIDVVMIAVPQSKELTYNGSLQELIFEGEVEGGTLYYAVVTDFSNAPDDANYSTAIPSAEEVGYYYVWYKVEGDDNHNDLAPVCIKVVLAEDDWTGLRGVVYQYDGETKLVGALVSLMQGNDIIDSVITDIDGKYQFTVPDGVYNIVVGYEGITETVFVELFEKTEQDIVMPNGKTESILQVNSDDENGFGVAVGGLDEEAQAVREENPSADSVSVVMTVEQKTEETATNADYIIDGAKDKSLAFFDIKVEKTVDSVTTTIDETNGVMKIVIPYEKINKRGLIVYSYHDSRVRTFVESNTKEDGTFRVDKENGLIYIYSNSFSTYAIGYTPYYNVNGSISIGSFTGTAKITLVRVDDGLKFAYENVAMGSINFDDIPMGKYVMTVEWIDGVANTLTITLNLGDKTESVLDFAPETDNESGITSDTEITTYTSDAPDFSVETVDMTAESGVELAFATYENNEVLSMLQKQIVSVPTLKFELSE